jgi:hypothetical protein
MKTALRFVLFKKSEGDGWLINDQVLKDQFPCQNLSPFFYFGRKLIPAICAKVWWAVMVDEKKVLEVKKKIREVIEEQSMELDNEPGHSGDPNGTIQKDIEEEVESRNRQ